jgi:diacylglycerol kinase family enzyme
MGGDQEMVTTDQQVLGRATVAQRWLARLGLVAAVAAVLVPLVAIGFRASVALVAVGLVGMGLAVAGLWWALTHRGVVRGLALVLVVAAPVTILVLYTSAGLAWVVVVAVALVGVAVAAGRAALARDPGPGKMPESDAPPPQRPFLIMNPRSGGGKVGRFALKAKAEALGAEVALLEGPEVIDVGLLAREAVAAGADLLGVAGGDGTQALVAGIAAEHDIPLLVISAGTRNHFALDLGLDREDPSRCLDALADGVELNVYGMGDIAGLGRRARMDTGTLGVFAVTVASAVQAAGLLRGTSSRGLTRLATPEVVIDADAAQIPVGVDGEALVLDTPVRCSIRPGVLRVRVPRNRPGVPDVTPQLNWKRPRQLAPTGPGTGRAAPQDG